MNARLFLYWIIAGLPLGWGVYQTFQKSLPLFTVGSTLTSVSAPAGTPPAQAPGPEASPATR